MQNLIVTFMLLTPMDFKHEVCWVGFQSFQAGNVHGYTTKLVLWSGGGIVLEFGKWNRLLVTKTLW